MTAGIGALLIALPIPRVVVGEDLNRLGRGRLDLDLQTTQAVAEVGFLRVNLAAERTGYER